MFASATQDVCKCGCFCDFAEASAINACANPNLTQFSSREMCDIVLAVHTNHTRTSWKPSFTQTLLIAVMLQISLPWFVGRHPSSCFHALFYCCPAFHFSFCRPFNKSCLNVTHVLQWHVTLPSLNPCNAPAHVTLFATLSVSFSFAVSLPALHRLLA